jgi:hypothetical protein
MWLLGRHFGDIPETDHDLDTLRVAVDLYRHAEDKGTRKYARKLITKCGLPRGGYVPEEPEEEAPAHDPSLPVIVRKRPGIDVAKPVFSLWKRTA